MTSQFTEHIYNLLLQTYSLITLYLHLLGNLEPLGSKREEPFCLPTHPPTNCSKTAIKKVCPQYTSPISKVARTNLASQVKRFLVFPSLAFSGGLRPNRLKTQLANTTCEILKPKGNRYCREFHEFHSALLVQ